MYAAAISLDTLRKMAGNIPESAALRQRFVRGLPADVFSQVELDGVGG